MAVALRLLYLLKQVNDLFMKFSIMSGPLLMKYIVY